MSKYLITLTPTGKFFFGGDMGFKLPEVKGNKDFNQDFSSYIIRSNKFPQQTSLLGMLRFLILSNNTLAFDVNAQKIKDKKRASELIGSKSFCVNDNSNDYGLIKLISQCFLQYSEKDNDKWIGLLPAPKDHGIHIDFRNSVKGTFNGKEMVFPNLPEHDFKNSIDRIFISDVKTEGIKVDDVFVEDSRLGINRDIKTGKTEDSALYKQINYSLNNKEMKYRFAFEADIDCEDLMDYSNQIVSIGGDSSQFVIGIEKIKDSTIPFLPKSDNMADKVVLTSPSFLSSEDVKMSSFAITETIPFRFLNTEVEKTESYNRISGKISRSKRYELYNSGSVFYFQNKENRESFIKALESKKGFSQIGYNQYQENK